MGVTGLWQVVDSVGHPIKLEGLEGKQLGVDANLWLYKFIRGFRDRENAANINAHKLGLFNRVSKLLFYKIKPVFVFDGPAPILKSKTLEKRQGRRNVEYTKVQNQAVKLLAAELKRQYPDAKLDKLQINIPDLKSHNLVLAEKLTDEDRELFYLPPEEVKLDNQDEFVSDEDDDIFFEEYKQATDCKIDIQSEEFEQLPAEIRYEYLTDIRDRNKRVRRAAAMPEDAESFSSFQLKRLKSKRSIQEKIEKCEKDIQTNYTGEVFGQTVQSLRVQSDASSTMLYGKKEHSATKCDQKPIQDLKIPNKPSEQSNHEEESYSVTVTRIKKDKPILIAPLRATPLDSIPNEVNLSEESDNDTNDFFDVSQTSHSGKTNQISEETKEEIDTSGSSTDIDHEGDILQFSESPARSQTHVENTSLDTSDDESLESVRDKSPQEAANDPPSTSLNISESKSELTAETFLTASHSDIISETVCIDSAPSTPDNASKTICIESSPSIVEDCHRTVYIDSTPTISSQSSRESTPFVSAPSTQNPTDDKRQTEREEPLQVPDETGAELRGSLQAELAQSSQAISDKPSQTVSLDWARISHELPERNLRNTTRVTTRIIEEAKELLTLFGVPFIDATGEAEAQLALLEQLKLTEGTITDDSDVWLFGAQNVFRHFFSDDKYVLQYKMSEIEFHTRLSRSNLICFAMLVGSDYTEGVHRVGPVAALDILNEFPGDGLEPLLKFKQWREQYDGLKKGKIPGSKKRESFLKYHLPEGFPSRVVYDGYMQPAADPSREKFSWAIPDLDDLREYARRNFGWDLKKIDDKLLPVLKRLNERKTQPTIDSFFTTKRSR